MKNRRFIFALKAVFSLLVLLLIYFYPLQWILCRIAYNRYIKEQGISDDEIVSSWARKIPKVDGWEVEAVYKTDPNNHYYYVFHLFGDSGTRMGIGRMSCVVMTAEGEEPAEFLYPPLPSD